MQKPSFDLVWSRIVQLAGKPFVTDLGREFHYEIEPGDTIRFSGSTVRTPKAIVGEGWNAMPCDAFRALPQHCKPRNFLWALLHDTRISGLLPPDDAKTRRAF